MTHVYALFIAPLLIIQQDNRQTIDFASVEPFGTALASFIAEFGR